MVQAAPILRMVSLTKQFGRLLAVNDVSLDIEEGEFFTIVGPSGSGKTTLLRMLGGLEKPTAGDIFLRDERVNTVPANRRPTCMVFQSLALFNHKTVGQAEHRVLPENARREPRRAPPPRPRADERSPAPGGLLRQVRDQMLGRRASARRPGAGARLGPDILFFDEPLSAIDYRLRKLLEVELKDLHRTTGKTFVYITHSLEEAMVMSDRIGIMQEGRLIQIGSPNEIYLRPRNKFVSEFMGEVNTLAVRTGTDGALDCPAFDGRFTSPARPDGFTAGYLVIRPESMRFLNDPSEAENHLRGSLFNEYALGSRVQYHVSAGEAMFVVEKLREQAYRARSTTPS